MRAISPSSRMISQMTPGGIEPGQARQIDGGLGLAGAHQHAAPPRAQRKDVAGTGQVGSCGLWIDRHANGVGAVGGGDAGGDALARLNGLSERGAEARGILLRHRETGAGGRRALR